MAIYREIFSGGGAGIGRATAQLFSREGASVVVADINQAEAEKTVHSLPKSQWVFQF